MAKKKSAAEGEIEKTYQKKTQLEHILLRPDTYIGTTEKIREKMWVIDEKSGKMINKEIEYVPGLYKIFDEILVNAVDNISRDQRMSLIKVDITPKRITIFNNGKGIPIKIHNTYNIYVPELIFGHLLTSSNYNDNEKKITGGRNGFGAKLTNVFSKLFIVETADKKVKKKYKIEYSDNMTKHKEAEIEKYEGEDFTRVTFEPDFRKFKMTELDNDIISLLKKRVYDIAGTSPSRIKVYLNDKLIEIKDFSEYADLYIKNRYFDEDSKVLYPKILANSTDRWEVIFSMTDGSFQQVSFVNGICTSKGGTHVNYILDQILERILETIKKKAKDIKLNTNQIKQNIWVFINCKIENPSFDSQTKETLTSKVSNFGSECIIKEKFIKEILKSNIVTNIIEYGKAKAKIKLHKALSSTVKKSSRLLGIEKLEDANLAGTKDFEKCTLILTEGDSAKCLAMAGIEVVGRDYYGCFPLRGKVLNVRGAKDAQIIKNEEIQNVIKILGLKVGMDYSNDLKGMRYGHLLIMTDQDYDGSHIKGLIINFIHFFWPSLIKRKDFLQEFITPIVKATKEGQKPLTFFTMKEYSDWFNNNNHAGYKFKYYKGLGTSTSKEAKEYFSEINRLRLNFKYVDNEDDKSIELGFSKDETEGRKNWLLNFDPFNTYLDQSLGDIRYKNFINEELIFFSYYDNIRSIPSMMDGLKPSERKILFGCFKRNLRTEIKVAQLTGYIGEVSSYHHGEISLSQTITALAQDYVGSNNINLLLPLGQFGTRYNGIKGAASPRYIFTNLNPITRKIFIENDDNLLLYNVEEGLKIEPVWYAPIIPMVLVNGAEGIGTGWSTSVPEYNPIDLAENLIRKIKGQNMEKMLPWYKGFHGKIIESFDNKGNSNFVSSGVININDDNETVEITELPVHTFTRDYKTFLEKNHIDNKEYAGKKDFIIEDIKEYHIDNRISFVLKLNTDSFNEISRLSNDDLIKLFKLTSNIPTTNMVLFDSKNKIKKYNKIEEIIDEFYEVRLDFYKQRKNYLLAKIGFALEKNKNKKKFINMVLEGELPFKGSKNKKEVFKLLKEKGFTSLNELKTKYNDAFKVKSTEIVTENNNENNKEDVLDYDYLMNMNIWSLTHEKVNELEETIKNQTNEYEFLLKSKPEDLWIKDLVDLISAYKKVINNLDEKNQEAENKIKENQSKVKVKNKKNKKTKNDRSNNNLSKKNKKKKKDSFIDDSDEEAYSIYSSSSSVSSEENDENENDGDYTIYSKSSKKQNKPKTKKQQKIILLDEEEEESSKKNKANKNTESNQKIEKIKKKLTENEQNLLAEIGVKEIKNSKDPSKLTLRERLALRVAKGNIGTMTNKENITPVKLKNDLSMKTDLDIKDVEEMLDNDFLGKKTKTSNKKLVSEKKDGKISTKRKKVIDDSDEDMDDEDFKL
jgi:DNA topoisomerase-2